jgi:hypothetical protein
MNTAQPTVTNIADDAARVGVQAGVVHELHQTYNLGPDASPQRKYEIGVRYLDNGVASHALELIDEAIAQGYSNSEVRFHRLLALMSGRTLQMLSQEDFGRLEAAYEKTEFGPGEWADGVRFIEGMLRNIAAEKGSRSVEREDLEKLGDLQRRKVVRHLEMFLKGPSEDHAWWQIVQDAAAGQFDHDRRNRAWKFFEPEPEPPRMVWPERPGIGGWTVFRLLTAGFPSVLAAGYLGVLIVQRGQVSALLAYVSSVVFGAYWARFGADWRFRNEWLRTKDRQLSGIPGQRRPPPVGGFAEQVDRIFRACFRRYVPVGVDRQIWLDGTIGLRRTIRDEIVTSYRDGDVDADAIAWLIRHRVGVVKRQWQRGTLWDYRDRYRTSFARKFIALVCAFATAAAALRAVIGAVPVQPLRASIAVLVMLIGSWAFVVTLLPLAVERRRYAAELAENREVHTRSRAAYDRWVTKLADTPGDSEMAAWLECDRVLVMESAFRHYKLKPSNMIGRTFIEAPAGGCEAAREHQGPWRFSRYQMLLFLLTTDGVRQVNVELDFLNVTAETRERTNYRFDAVASVRVTHGDKHDRNFELTLVSGYKLEVPVTGARDERPRKGEAPGMVTDLTVDAAGLRNTLHILEGVAAEGKGWIAHEDQRGGDRIRRLRRVFDEQYD